MKGQRFMLLVAEILAIALLRAWYIYRRDTVLPHGAKVRWIRGVPVIPISLINRATGRTKAENSSENSRRYGSGRAEHELREARTKQP